MRVNPKTIILLGALLGSSIAQAQTGETVTLRSLDGFTQLRGEIVSFDGKTFSIRTGLGTINVDAMQVECEGEACPKNLMFGAEFGVYGSNTIGASLMPSLIQGYADQLDADLVQELSATENERTMRIIHQNGEEMAAIDLRAHGSGTAATGLGDGNATIGMASRRIKDNEVASLRAAGIPELRDTDHEHILALDGLIIVTHPDNPLNSIELDELPYVFSGEVTNWSELGGPDQEIILHARNDESGTFDTFDTLVLDPAAEEISTDALRFESNAELSDAVSRTPGAIGFTGAAYARAAKVLNLKQACGIISEPTTFSMKTEEYPLSRRLYLYDLPSDAPAHSRQLVDFALSPAAQGIVEEAGFVSLGEERTALANQGQRLVHAIVGEPEFALGDMRAMLTELREAERLSVTFRFNQGTNLDPRSLRDAITLAEGIAAGEYPGKEILLVGFTDSIGQAELNRSLSLRRANEVYAALASVIGPTVLAELPVRTLGFGEIAPVGCNTTFAGRENNRRVEVWLRDLQG
ncbi:phosphate ABC transporter substrate-binding/OmpA family protein [Rhodobacteraceae bacterium NNCM2]|nr:phosphate ABC transporter substrate-binding/OmpA family protein [Coraliihabitans acroporae]